MDKNALQQELRGRLGDLTEDQLPETQTARAVASGLRELGRFKRRSTPSLIYINPNQYDYPLPAGTTAVADLFAFPTWLFWQNVDPLMLSLQLPTLTTLGLMTLIGIKPIDNWPTAWEIIPPDATALVPAASATVTLNDRNPNPVGTLAVTATRTGAWGNGVLMTVSASARYPSTGFSLAVSLGGAVVETFNDLLIGTANAGSVDYVATRVNGVSELVRVTDLASTTGTPLNLPVPTLATLTGGADGNTPVTTPTLRLHNLPDVPAILFLLMQTSLTYTDLDDQDTEALLTWAKGDCLEYIGLKRSKPVKRVPTAAGNLLLDDGKELRKEGRELKAEFRALMGGSATVFDAG